MNLTTTKASILRHILGYAGGLLGGWAIAKGYVTQDTWAILQDKLILASMSALGGSGALTLSLMAKRQQTEATPQVALSLMAKRQQQTETPPQTPEIAPNYFTLEVLTAAGWSKANVGKFFQYLQAGCTEYGITTPLRLAHFIAQISQESLCGTYTRELWDGKGAQALYDTRADLGNTPEHDGDGYHNRGVGLIQVTGENNIEATLKALGYAPDDNDALASPEGASLSACYFWYRHGLNEVAERSGADVSACTRVINGGYNGLKERQAYFDRVMSYYAVKYL
jgi:putative chitinase